MELTNAQRLGLAMLAEIHKKLDIRDGVNSELVAKALWSHNDWAINWEHGMLFDDSERNPPHVKHVVEVLEMYDFLERSYAAIADDGRALIAEAYPYGSPTFPGFDGNEESEYYSAAQFLIEDLHRFQRFKDHDLNSHAPTVEASERMLDVYRPIRAAQAQVHGMPNLSPQQIADVMAARLIRRE